MNVCYLNAKEKINRLKNELDKLLSDAAYVSMEDMECYKALEHLNEELEDTARTINYYSLPVRTGILMELPNGRFELCNRELTCGTAIELYDHKEEAWLSGRVEHKSGGYYFYGQGNPFLIEGMEARMRIG